MKTRIVLILMFAGIFCLGFAFKTYINKEQDKMKRVTGIGGIFFKSKDPEKMLEGYHKHLGLETNPYGATFEWYQKPDSSAVAQTQWTPFAESSKYFEKDYMINYRVENPEALVEELKKEGVTVVDEIESYDYGKFVHIPDGEGNKVQLWEPVD